MTTSPDQQRRIRVLADLNTQAALLRREIASYQLKIEFYASDCSDGAEAYAAEMGVHIAKAEASLREIEMLISELETAPAQLALF